MKESVNGFFESMISRNDDSDYEYSEYSDSDESVEGPEYVDLLNNPDYEIVYEKHGWSFVKEFFSEFSTLDEGQDYPTGTTRLYPRSQYRSPQEGTLL